MRRRFDSVVKGCVLAATVALVAAAPAGAHIERPSYWPLPQADCSIHPCAGGKVPAARSLQFALKPPRWSHTRVVCQSDSLTRLKRSIASARRSGYYIRPTDHRSLSKQAAARLLAVNRALFARCRYHEIQPAVTASHNQDTVVIMPALYTEPGSRAKPTFDPSCKQYEITDNGGGDISG